MATPTREQAAVPVAQLCAVSKSFMTAGSHELKVLDNIDLAVNPGEFLALLGQSGSGKSTILRCLTGLIEPTSGRALGDGKSLHGVNPDASVVFQTFALYPWLNVEQNVAVGLMARRLGRAERDVLTAENLRQELISLWRSPDSGLSSVFMVTHNIEEAVEMATRIVVVFPRPGRIGLVLENKLPFPRDSKHPEFQRLVSVIHESITTMTLPELPPEVPVSGQPVSRARSRMESIPLVPVGQILGLMSILSDAPHLSNIYDISDEIGKEFGETIAILKAAEILDLIDTPKQEVRFTELGRKFVAADRLGKRAIFAEQVFKLRLFHIIIALLKEYEEVEAEKVIKDIGSALPYDNPEKTFETMIAWGRYAGLMDYNAKTRLVFVPAEEDDAEDAQL